MLTAFELEGQRYEAVLLTRHIYFLKDKPRTPENRRIMSIATWRTTCPDCGQAFEFDKPTKAFCPAALVIARCPPCRSIANRRKTNRHLNKGQYFCPISGSVMPTIPRIRVHDGPDPDNLQRKKTGRRHVIQAVSGLSAPRTDPKPPPKAKGPPPAGHFRD